MNIIIRDVNGNTLYSADTYDGSRPKIRDGDGVLDGGIYVLEAHQSDNFESIIVTVETT